MNHRAGFDRHQTLLLPETLEDYLGPEHPARFLDAFVASLDLNALGFLKAVPCPTGRPPYDPGDLLRLYLYGCLHRVRSSRQLERECGRNLEVLWLMRKLAPDHKDHRRLSPRQPGGPARRVAAVHAPLPEAGTLRRRTGGHRRHEGGRGQQPGAQLQRRQAGRAHRCRRRPHCRVSAGARLNRCRRECPARQQQCEAFEQGAVAAQDHSTQGSTGAISTDGRAAQTKRRQTGQPD